MSRRCSCIPPIKLEDDLKGSNSSFELNTDSSDNSPPYSPIQAKEPRTRSSIINNNKRFFRGILPAKSYEFDLDSQNVEVLQSKYNGDVVISCIKKKESFSLECKVKGYHIKIVDYISNCLNELYVYPIEQLMNLEAVEAIKGVSDYNVDILYAVINFIDMLIENDIPFGLKNIIVVSGIPIANAYWNGLYLSIGWGCYSPRKDKNVTPLCSPDIIAHELGHAVIEETCNLEYFRDSGALNESIADIFGIALEYYLAKKKQKHRGLCIEDTNVEWGIGNEIIWGGMRSFSSPWEHQQPKLMYDRYWYVGNNDYGGVHTNSGVLNYYFFRLVNIRPFWEALHIIYDALKRSYTRITIKEFHRLLPQNLYIDII